MPLAVTLTRTADPAGVATVANVATYSSVSIGTASSDRIVWVECTYLGTSGQTVTSATIDSGGGAVTMNKSTTAQMTNSTGACFFWLRVPTGTTATIAVTYSAALIAAANHITVGTATNSSDPTFQTNTSTDMDSTAPLSLSITVPVSGAAKGCAACGVTGTSHTWANFTGDLSVGTGTFRYEDGSKTTSGTTTTTLTGTTNGEDGSLVIAMFGPLPDASRVNSSTTELPKTSSPASLQQSKTAIDWIQSRALINDVLRPLPVGKRFVDLPNPLKADQVAKQWIKSFLPQTPQFTLGPGGVTQSDLFLPVQPALTFFNAGRAPWDYPKGAQFWALPRDTDRKALSWIESGNTTSPFVTVLAPGIQYWTIQQTKLPPALSFIGPKTQESSAKPFSQTDWPLPSTSKYPDSLRTYSYNVARFDTGFQPGSVSDWGVYLPPKQWFEIPQTNLNLLTSTVAKPFAQTDWPLPLSSKRVALSFSISKNLETPVLPTDLSLPRFGRPFALTFIGSKTQETAATTLPPNQYNWPLPTTSKYPDLLRTYTYNVSRFDTGFMPGSISDWGVYIPPKQWFEIPQANMGLLTAPAASKPPLTFDWSLPRTSPYPNSLRTLLNGLPPSEFVFREAFLTRPFDVNRKALQWLASANPSTIPAAATYLPSGVTSWGPYISPALRVGDLFPNLVGLATPPQFPSGKKPVDQLFVPPIFRFEPQAQKNIQLLNLKPFGELRTERPYPPAYLNFRFPAQEQKNIGLLSTFPPGKNGVYPPKDTDRVAKTWINQDALQLTPPPTQPKPNGIYPVPRESMFPKTGLFWQSNFTRFGHRHEDEDDETHGRPFDRHRPRRNPTAFKMPLRSVYGRR